MNAQTEFLDELSKSNEMVKAKAAAVLAITLAMRADIPLESKYDIVMTALDCMGCAYRSHLSNTHARIISDLLPDELDPNSLLAVYHAITLLGARLLELDDEATSEGKRTRDIMVNLIEMIKEPHHV